MDENKKGTEKELLQYLVKENMFIHAQFRSLKMAFKVLFGVLVEDGKNPQLNADLFEKAYKKSIDDNLQQILADHPLLETSWKKKIQEHLGEIPGLDLS